MEKEVSGLYEFTFTIERKEGFCVTVLRERELESIYEIGNLSKTLGEKF